MSFFKRTYATVVLSQPHYCLKQTKRTHFQMDSKECFLSITNDSVLKLTFRNSTVVYAKAKPCPKHYDIKKKDCGEDFQFYIYKQAPSIYDDRYSPDRLTYSDDHLPFAFHLMGKYVWYQTPCKNNSDLGIKRYRFEALIDKNNWMVLYLVDADSISNEWKVEKYIYCVDNKMITKY